VILDRAACARIGGWIAKGQIWARLLVWARLRRDAWRLRRSGAIDPVWYRSAYPDVTDDPALHYLRRGRAEGRAPLPLAPLPLPRLPLTDTNYRRWIGMTEAGRGDDADALGDDAVLFLPPGMVLAPGALREMAAVLAASPEVDVITADEDCIDAAGQRCTPWFKPAWDPILAETCDLTCGAGVVRRALLERLGYPKETTPHRLACAAGPDRIRHIPSVLFHRPLSLHQPVSLRAQRSNLAELTHAAGQTPLVSIIIPTRDRAPLLARCVDSVLHRTDYPAIELIIVDNGSRQRRTSRLLARLDTDPRVRVLRHPGPFNWSAMNNAATRLAHGQVLVLLNNDIEALDPGWVRTMAALALRPEIGVVGARLLYPDGTLQHAGITLEPGAIATHPFSGAAPDDPGYGRMLRHTRSVAAVTGACMVLRRDVFDAAGGFEEDHLAVTNNDVDFCLRVRAQGLRVVCTPQATLLHREAASRGMDERPAQQARVRREREYLLRIWGRLAETDPYLSPNLSTVHGKLVLASPSPRQPIAGEPGGNALDIGEQIGWQPGGREAGATDIQRIRQPTEPVFDGNGDVLVGADRGEQRNDIVGDLGGHLGPLAGLGHGVELAPEVAQPV
jgi:GT2 family glycosyltransferase